MNRRTLKVTLVYAIGLLIASLTFINSSNAGVRYQLDSLYTMNCKEVSFNTKQVYFRCQGKKKLLAYSRKRFESYYGKVTPGMEIKAKGENPLRQRLVASGD